MTRQIYMHIILIMKFQKLQMKLLNCKESNESSFLLTTKKFLVLLKVP